MDTQWWRFSSTMTALWLRIKFYFAGALDAYSGRRFSRQEAVSRHSAVYMGWVLHTVARKQQDTQSQDPQGVCGWRAGVCMSLARAWEADAMVCAGAWRKVCVCVWRVVRKWHAICCVPGSGS